MVRNRYAYDVFGSTVRADEVIRNRYWYNGELYDCGTEQYYLRARFYNPVTARFTQEDVYRGDGLNLYAYCGNNAVGYEDPSGYAKCKTGKKSKTPAERAAEKGYANIGTTSNGGADFKGSGYVYLDSSGKEVIVKITMTGSRGKDFTQAFNEAGIPRRERKGIKENYTWHHVDDFDPVTGTCTMQLVLSDAHVATYPHKGSVSQYEKHYGVDYK